MNLHKESIERIKSDKEQIFKDIYRILGGSLASMELEDVITIYGILEEFSKEASDALVIAITRLHDKTKSEE